MRGPVSDVRTFLLFTNTAGPCQSINSPVRVPLDSDHISLSQDSRLPQSGEPGTRIYFPQEQVGPDIDLGTGFPFRRLLLLAGLQ
jgi:hypothetical protein